MSLNKLSKNLNKIKLITFDVTDTLLFFRNPPSFEYSKIAQNLGHHLITPEKVSSSFSTHFKYMTKNYPNFGKENDQLHWKDWWRMLISNVVQSIDTRITKEQTQCIADKLIEYYQTDECYVINHLAYELITEIRQQKTNIKIGIISNFDPRLKIVVEQMQLPKFDFILASYEVGVAKPSRLIFSKAHEMSSTQVHGNESLHIGNTPTLDYIAARSAGWNSVLITNNTDDWHRYKNEINENHVFKSLSEFYCKLKNTDIEW